MTSLERIIRVTEGKETDRIPVAPEVFGVTARLCGHTIYKYVTDGSIIAHSQLEALKEIGHDVVFAFADLSVEAEALGCTLRYDSDAYPAVEHPILRDPKDIAYLSLPDPQRHGRMPVLLEATRLLRESLRDSCLILACVMGPFSIASQIMGLEKLLYMLVDTPGELNRILDFTEEVAGLYGESLVKAGAHAPIVFDPSASPSVIPAELFASLEAPRLRRLYQRWKKLGVRIFWISIAGQTRRIIPYLASSGVTVATIDYMVSLSDAIRASKDMVFNGNIKPYLFVNSTPGEIEEEVFKCLRAASGSGRYIIGSGCEIPLESRIENIRALVEASRRYVA